MPVIFSGPDYRFNFNMSDAIMTDLNGNIWIAGDYGLTELKKNADGNYTPLFYSAPLVTGLATDSSGNVWIANQNNTFMGWNVKELKKNNDGSYDAVFFSGSNYGFDRPWDIAADQQGNIWVKSMDSHNVTELKKNPEGRYSPIVFSNSQYAFVFPNSVTDSQGNVWVINMGENTVTEIYHP